MQSATLAGKTTLVSTIGTKPMSFAIALVVIFFFSYAALGVFGLTPFDTTPTLPDAAAAAPQTLAGTAATTTGEYPVRVVVPSIHLDVSVSNPETTNVDTLDEYLLKGAVHYPGSGNLGATGNVLLFGHSSYLPVVHNQSFKAFDGIQNLGTGNTIVVYSRDKAYTYAVESVQKENTATGSIPLDVTGQKLTLATCNSFATKADRFVVTAHLVSSQAI